MSLYKKQIQHKVVLALLILCSHSIMAETKIGFVDMETLIESSPQINSARSTISLEFEAQYSDIKQKSQDLTELENRITKDGQIMSTPELAKLQERARILDRQIRRSEEDLKDAISIRNSIILNKLQEDLNLVVKQYAIEHGYDAILINSILYVSQEMDITQEILQVLKKNNSENEN